MAADAGIQNAWHRVLQDLELAKRWRVVVSLQSTLPAHNPVLDSLLPSLLYVRVMSVLDEGLLSHIERGGARMPRRYPNSLHGRLAFLDDRGVLASAEGLMEARQRRNEIAHTASEEATWADLRAVVSLVQGELQHLGCVGPRPKYEFYAERSAMRASADPDVVGIVDHCFGLKLEGQRVVEFSWTANFHRTGA